MSYRNFHGPLSRRSLLNQTALLFAGTSLGLELDSLVSGSRLFAQKASLEYAPFRMCFQSYSLRRFTETNALVEQASKLKLHYVELWRGHLKPDASTADMKRVSGKLAQAGIKVVAFGVESFSADHEKNDRLFKFGKMLGLENLSADPSQDSFPSLEKLVKQYDIRIAIHNHGPEDKRWQKPEWVLAAVKDLDPRIGSCADLGHFILAGVDPVEALEMLGRRVLGCHFKDFDKQGKDVVVGTGQLDVVRTLKTLKKIGFKGPISLEFEGDQQDPIPKMLECLKVIREAVRQI